MVHAKALSTANIAMLDIVQVFLDYIGNSIMLSSGITVAASRVVRPLQTLKGAVHSVAVSPVGQILDGCSDVSREGDNI
jgi:hypothetical protein